VDMSVEPILRVRARSSSGSGRALRLPMLVLGAGIWVLAPAEASQGWETMRLAGVSEPPARIGDLVSATLVNGQVVFGALDGASRTTNRLRDDFFAQLPTGASTQAEGERTPSILRRQDNGWTKATVMAIPVERIGFMETVGVDSRMARFISDARARPAGLPGVGPSDNGSGGTASPKG
jgi:hypothetical protein